MKKLTGQSIRIKQKEDIINFSILRNCVNIIT